MKILLTMIIVLECFQMFVYTWTPGINVTVHENSTDLRWVNQDKSITQYPYYEWYFVPVRKWENTTGGYIYNGNIMVSI